MSSRDSGERPVPLKSEPANPKIGEMNSAGEVIGFFYYGKNLGQTFRQVK